jgi:hypothetical protein
MAFALMTKSKRAAAVPSTTQRQGKAAIAHGTFGAQAGFDKPTLRLHSPKPAMPPVIQTKLKVGEPNDEFEQEADQVADEVRRIPDSAIAVAASPGSGMFVLQRQCACGNGAMAASAASAAKSSDWVCKPNSR